MITSEKIAIIDLGTNTFNLLIANIHGESFTQEYLTKEFVKLGEGGINQQIILPLPFQRGLTTLLEYKLKIDQQNCTKIFAIGTSALRNAKNGNDFIQKAYDLTGIKIAIIDGNTEADLIYQGAVAALQNYTSPAVFMDIGGGSTEFIISQNDQILWKKSVEVGVNRLFQAFHHEDPISLENQQKLHNHLSTELNEVIQQCVQFNVKTLVGCSGAFTSIAAMIAFTKGKLHELKGKRNYVFNLTDYLSIHNLLVQSTLKQRLKIQGLIPERAPMMVVGTILVNFILKNISIQHFMLSRYALKEGVAVSYAKGKLNIHYGNNFSN